MENKRGLQRKAEESFDLLNKYRRRKLVVDYFQFGNHYSEELILRGVNDYKKVFVGFPGGTASIEFINPDTKTVIREISSLDGKVLYENKNISKDSDLRNKDNKYFEDLSYSTFGVKRLSSLELILPNQSNNNSKNPKPWYSQLDDSPRRELFR